MTTQAQRARSEPEASEVHAQAQRARSEPEASEVNAQAQRARSEPEASEVMPGRLQHVHFVAIGGTGMGSLAGLVKARGIEVTGSDKALYPPMSTALENWGIPVFEGFDPAHVRERRPDLVVIGNAVRPDNPEARSAIEDGIPYRSFSDALYELAIASKHSVVVTGTHGKTTTTSLVAYLLHATGREPSLLVGGISLDFDGSFREAGGDHFVVEGDEYDTAFFDKTPKFLHYHPRTLIITSVEFDHADIYRDLDHVKSAFRELVAGMPQDGTIIAAWDHPNVREVVSGAGCRVISYGNRTTREGGVPDWLARDLEPASEGTRFRIQFRGAEPMRVRTPLHGRFNVENVLAALSTLEALGVPAAESAAALPGFLGVKRRQEIRGEAQGVTVVDDFAHHPTAVCASIEALRQRFPDRRLVAVFEPRSNTSRRKVFQEDYARAFDGADRVVLRAVPDEPIYSATGEVSERLSADQLAASLRARGLSASAFGEVEEIVAQLLAEHCRGDVVLIMSNGAFGNIWEKLLEALGRA
jgi:UDP-N-acetylmuramate: L-alanyl-gamma-D-glutamyl-meso-diaminopimelate ligase